MALTASHEKVRSQAAWALGLKGNAIAVTALIGALRDPNANVRSQAAWALGLKGDARAVEPLRNTLNDPDANVRKQARWALDLRDLKMGKRIKSEPLSH
jgi:HEAT repeat protein